MIEVECNGEVHKFQNEVSANDVVKKIYGKNSDAVAALVDEEQKDLSHLLHKNCRFDIIKGDSDEGLYILRHSCAHLLAQAVTELFPDAKPTIGPPTDDGFYYDFFMNPIDENDLRNIERLMKKIVKQNLPIQREEYNNETLREIFSDNSFKIALALKTNIPLFQEYFSFNKNSLARERFGFSINFLISIPSAVR